MAGSSWDDGSSFNLSACNLDDISNLELSALCCDEDYLGFDKNSGSTWIYPTNYPMRDYQFNIVRASLFKNTLVSLPTGLGKTFIAAVVMYNFYRWYPMGKIIFVAPTRPLVAQQIDACYKIMAIPPEDTIEMTGSMATALRRTAWRQKRIVFATPQVVCNDLESGACPGELVRCLVVDEAHRARGRHSYCQLVEALFLRDHKLFRMLALSATPGSKVEDVINVVQNLKIAHLELRTEECIDVAMYSHSRKIQTVVIELGDELSRIINQFHEIVNIYSRRLVQYKVLNGNTTGFTKGRIIMLYKDYQSREKASRHPQHKYIMLDFTMIITLYHALELLTKHGARVFLNFFDEHKDKTWVGKDDKLTLFLERLRDDLGPNPLSFDISTLPDGTVPEINVEFKFGHPKFDHLKKIMLEHFKGADARGQETKAIVFCEYRESVNLVHRLLLQCRPLIKPLMFVGQGLAGSNANGQQIKPFSQKQQLRAMQSFRQGTSNVLVSTCVGEEGLDVGSVDLIICFDISNKSPVRLVQRCGRTGRERGGRVVILVTEGKEHQTLKDCMSQRDNLKKRVLQSKELQNNLFKSNPRLLPQNVKPECFKMFITVKKVEENEKDKKGQKTLDDLFKKPKNSSSEPINLISELQYREVYGGVLPKMNYFADEENMWNMSKKELLKLHESEFENEQKPQLSNWIEWQRILQSVVLVDHSIDSKDLSSLLQFADLKRFEASQALPSTDAIVEEVQQVEMPISENQFKKCSPTKRKVKGTKNNQVVKNTDIRAMFTKIDRMNNKEQWTINDKYKEIFRECGFDENDQNAIDAYLKENNISSALIDLMIDNEIEKSNKVETVDDWPMLKMFANLNLNSVKSKKIDTSLFENYSSIFNEKDSIIDSSLDRMHNLIVYDEKRQFESYEIVEQNINEDSKVINDYKNNFNMVKVNENINEEINNEIIANTNWDVIDIDTIFEEVISPIIPNECKIDNKTASPGRSQEVEDLIRNNDHSPIISKLSLDYETGYKSASKNTFLEESNLSKQNRISTNTTSTLEFFGLGNLDDIFDDSIDEAIPQIPETEEIVDSQPKSEEEVLSPILLTQRRNNTSINKSKLKKKKNLFNQPVQNETLLSITQMIDIITDDKESSNEKSIPPVKVNDNASNLHYKSDINWDIFDENDSDESSHSIILCTQKSPKKPMTQKTLPKVIIPESSESSDDCVDEEKQCSPSIIKKINESISTSIGNSISKRKLDSDENQSPFFNKIPKVGSPSLLSNRKSLSDKLKLSLSSSQHCFENILEKKDSQKENIESNKNGPFSHVSQLSVFRRDSSSKFNNRSNHKHEISKTSLFSDDSDDFVHRSPQKMHRKRKRIKKKKKEKCQFIDYEAILSDDSNQTSSGSDSDDSSNAEMNSFICDQHTEDSDDHVDMESKYLQSVKSPVKTAGVFKMPAALKPLSKNIFSQPHPEQDTAYELDSFCVDNDIQLTQNHDMSELEIAEAILKKRKRRKAKPNNMMKKQKLKNDDSPIQMVKKSTRLRIDSQSSSSDSDDFK